MLLINKVPCSSCTLPATSSCCTEDGLRCSTSCKRIRFQMRKAVNGRQNARSNIPFFEQGKYTSTFGQRQPTLRDDSEEIELWEDQNMSKTSDDEITLFDKAQIGNEGEDPYRILDTGRKVYLDELDVLTLLDPPSFLIPMDANDYNQAAFLWKKIGDIPEERRHRLLSLLTSKQIANMWEIAGEMYESSDFPPPDSGTFLLGSDSESLLKPVSWTGKLADVPWPLSSFNRFKKIFFLGTDGSVYGRVITGGWLLQHVTRWILPLYFEVRDVRKVNAIEDPCNIALEYGEGQLHLDIPQGFPNPELYTTNLGTFSVSQNLFHPWGCACKHRREEGGLEVCGANKEHKA